MSEMAIFRQPMPSSAASLQLRNAAINRGREGYCSAATCCETANALFWLFKLYSLRAKSNSRSNSTTFSGSVSWASCLPISWIGRALSVKIAHPCTLPEYSECRSTEWEFYLRNQGGIIHHMAVWMSYQSSTNVRLPVRTAGRKRESSRR